MRVILKWKDYRIEGPGRYKTMTLDTHEFTRRFLMHYSQRDSIASTITACSLDAVMAPAQAFGEGWWLSPV